MLELVVSKNYLTVEVEDDICYFHFVSPNTDNVNIDEFLTLKDVFETTYTGKKGKAVIVNEDETGLIFGESGGGGKIKTVFGRDDENIVAENGDYNADQITETITRGWLTSTLKTAYDSAVTWISTNGQNILNHISDTVIHVTSSQKTKWTSDLLPLYCSNMEADIVASNSIPKIRYTFKETRTWTGVEAELLVAAVGGLFTIDIKKTISGVTSNALSTLLTFDSGESTTTTATTPVVLSANPTTFNKGDYIDIFVTLVGTTTAGRGLQVTLYTQK